MSGAGAAAEEARAAAGEPASAPPGEPGAGRAAPAGPSGAQLAGYAVSRYPDVPDVYRRLGDLVTQPIRPLRRDVMEGYLD